MIVVATIEPEVATVRARLHGLGVDHTQTARPSDDRWLVLAPVDDERESERIAAALRADGLLAVTRPDGGGALAGWMQHTRPLSFGHRLSVCFAWSEHDRRHLAGVVELGLGGFGNGGHASTRLLIEQLLERVTGGERVLDVGCGSGVLGLCAVELGASSVVAVDVKPSAVDATRHNAALNGVADRVDATVAPLADIVGEFDVVVANVGRAAAVELAPDLVRLVAPGGWLGVSGISPAQCSLVAGFLQPLNEIDRRASGEWAVIVFACCT